MVSLAPIRCRVLSSMLDGWLVVNHTRGATTEPSAFAPPGVHRLPEQRHVARPTRHEALDLRYHVLQRPAYHPSPDRRHDAVAALVIAAGHDRDERAALSFRSRKIRRVRLHHRRQPYELR